MNSSFFPLTESATPKQDGNLVHVGSHGFSMTETEYQNLQQVVHDLPTGLFGHFSIVKSQRSELTPANKNAFYILNQ